MKITGGGKGWKRKWTGRKLEEVKVKKKENEQEQEKFIHTKWSYETVEEKKENKRLENDPRIKKRKKIRVDIVKRRLGVRGKLISKNWKGEE